MVSVGRPVLAATVHGCTNVGVIFGWIVATYTRGRKVERKLLLDVSVLSSLKWKRGEE